MGVETERHRLLSSLVVCGIQLVRTVSSTAPPPRTIHVQRDADASTVERRPQTHDADEDKREQKEGRKKKEGKREFSTISNEYPGDGETGKRWEAVGGGGRERCSNEQSCATRRATP